ncbi:F-box protein At1g61340-like [Macadamia integrifolia]|uniref:F-box protein At1g61340-like n=1 Tax=Macadamia integrifolia TaxID=60698 RepID=UPI001C50017A|nr:F-box protein At1g61340-like [Macadamia integrifolia]XP_042486872.1 F-box protein At1g61340-like [Macadamia integrifolia]
MALGKSYSSKLKSRGLNASNVEATDEGLVLVHCTRAMGRKRIIVSNRTAMETLPFSSNFRTPSKRRQGMRTIRDDEKSLLEALPEDILVRILCCVYHDDLKQLIQVSKFVRDATLVAKQSHFAYSTPRAKISSLSSDLEHYSPEAPNAPRQQRCPRSRISRKKLSDISVALFHTPEDERWSRDGLFDQTGV